VLIRSVKSIEKTNICTWIYECDLFWWGNQRERDHWGDPGIDRRIILSWFFRKWDVGLCTGSRWLRIGTGVGYF